MLSQRLIFGAILIAVLIGLIFADQAIARSVDARLHGLVISVICAALVSLGTIELHRLFRQAGNQPLFLWPLLANLALVFAPLIVRWSWPGSGITLQHAEERLTTLLLFVAFAVTFLGVAARRRTERAIVDIAASTLIVVYLGLCPQFLVRLGVHAPGHGPWLLLYFVATVKFCDIGAYFTGYTIGKHKMIPWLSPKKTWEGLAGGVAASVLMAVLFPLIAGRGDIQAGLLLGITWPRAILFGVLMAVVGQAGDLLESLIKRDAQAKDSAAAVPAFGGVLDIIDSLLLTAPIAYWLLLE